MKPMSSPTDGPTAADSIPTDLLDGRYRLEALLGRGGMGTVYRGLDTRLNRPVAIKVLRDATGADEARFAAEVQTLARFTHPHLVRLLDAGELEARPYLVMDLVEGPTLAKRLSDGQLSSTETAKVGAGIVAALAYVHGAGIVHRDVKPANILLDAEGEAHLADFGIARLVDTTGLTAIGLTLGTPAYLAPEQVQGGDIGPPADVYALGLVLLECLSGHRAFEGTASEITAARLQRDPDIPNELDSGWQELLRAMTTRNAADRIPASAVATTLADRGRIDALTTIPMTPRTPNDETTVVLGRLGAGETQRLDPTEVALEPTSVAPRPIGGIARFDWHALDRRVIAAVLGLAVVVLLVGLAIGGVFSGPSTPARGDAPGKPIVTSPTTTSTTTTTTTIPPTTTVPPPSVASAAGALVTALETGVMNGSVTPQAGQQLTNQLQPLLFSPHPEQAQQEAQQFDQLVQQFDQAVQNGQITGRARIRVLTRAINSLAAALGTSVPTSTVPPGPPGGNGHGHGNGN
jgi:serine/threonine protein kinase